MKGFVSKLDSFFKISERGSSLSKELLGGVTIFLAMVYILPVNAGLLSQTGMSFGAVFAATAIAAAVASLIMGLLANYPIGLASGMGVNAFFTFTVVFGLGIPWQEALAAVLVSGLLFILVSVTGVRKKLIAAIPKDLKIAIGAGIGFFIAFIGLKSGGVIIAYEATGVSLGNLAHPAVLLALFGIVLALVLFAMKNRFAVIIAIVATGVIGGILGLLNVDFMPSFVGGNLGSVTDIKDTFGQAFIALPSLLARPEAYAVIFTFLFVDFFDTAGTLVAVGHDAGLLDKEGNLVGEKKALLADAIGTVVGASLGTSTVTSYVESTTGIQSGARTGLTAVVVGVLFLLSLLIYPLLGFVGGIDSGLVDSFGEIIYYSPVTAMALVLVGALMFKQVAELDWKDSVSVTSGFVAIIMMILTYSIADGIAFGLITYVVMLIASKRYKELNWGMAIMSLLFIIHLVLKFTVLGG